MKHTPTPPHALGELMLVPFISWDPCKVQLGTGEVAAPGAEMHTPNEPSGLCRHHHH